MKKIAHTGISVGTVTAITCTFLMGTAQAGFWSGLLNDPGQTQRRASAPLVLTAASTAYHDGNFLGPVESAYYGRVQVKANIKGGHLISVNVVQFPHDRPNSRRINHRALPMLQREVIKAQSTRVDIVSGATLTSRAYLRSLTSALGQASP